MKKYTIPQLISLLGMPALTVLLGLVLLFSPDTASALIGKILGWSSVLGALVFAFGARSGKDRRAVVGGILLGAVGVWMLMNPLFLASFMGRLLGIFLLLRGLGNLRMNRKTQGGKLLLTPGLVLSGAITLMGLVLILMPLATSRLVFSVVGIVLICVGAAEAIDRLKGRKALDEGDDPNIIDVEKL